AHATEQAPSFAELGLRSWVPRAVEQVVMQCLEKEPSLRPQSARELADLFESALAHPDEETLVRTPIGKGNASPPELDPDALVFQIEGGLPRRIAIGKIRGFVHDWGGDVVESGPGLIRVRVGARERPLPRGFVQFDRQEARRGKPVEMELRLQTLPADK